ncbi:hypothetical protein T492DRAFT_880343 [Pavlovales sp. CCMP2436]|nr:hypothetical protein T492DRAFT_880343 [Pavlovales sp. CCMP2436]
MSAIAALPEAKSKSAASPAGSGAVVAVVGSGLPEPALQPQQQSEPKRTRERATEAAVAITAQSPRRKFVKPAPTAEIGSATARQLVGVGQAAGSGKHSLGPVKPPCISLEAGTRAVVELLLAYATQLEKSSAGNLSVVTSK